MSAAVPARRVDDLPIAGTRPMAARDPRGFFALLRLWQRRAQERRELARLTPRELHDFGANRSEAIAEASKPFWQP